MRHLGIDLGNKKVGIALELEGLSIPKDIIPRIRLIPYMKTIIQDYDITHIIVGLPYDLYGVRTQQLERTQKFIAKLIKIFPNQVVKGYDERFTSYEARDDTNLQEDIDDVSASLILESYLRENIRAV